MIDWQKLKREVQIFIGGLLFALLLAGVTLYIQQQTAEHWQQSRNQLMQAKLRYETASNQKLVLEKYQQRYVALQKKHVLGEEQRIDWIEVIQSSSTRHGIPSVKFNLDQRNMATLPEDITNIAVYTSKMRLEMELMHEGDLYNLLADLDERAQGLYGINNCLLKHDVNHNADNVVLSNLSGTCELAWYMMGEQIEQQYDENGNPIAPEEMTQDGSEEI